MALTTKIGGATVKATVDTLEIERRVEERAVCSFGIPMEASPATFYSKGHPVEIKDGATVIFAGFIEQATLVPVGPAKYAYQVEAVDNCYLADKRVAAESYQNQTAGYIVKDLKDTYLEPEGVSVSDAEIEDGPTVKGAIFNYIRVSDALDALAERSNFWWRIDQDKVLHFKARGTEAAPFTLDDTKARRGSIKVEHGNPLYRNRQYVRGGQDITDSQVETRKGDGETRAWAMGFPLAKIPTVKVNTVTKTVGIKGLESGKNFYWSKGDPVIAQELLDTVLSSSDTLEVTYQGQFALVALTIDEAEIDGRKAREGGGTGYVDDVSQNPEADNREIAFEIGNAKLVKFATIGKRITFLTQTTGLLPGQLLPVNLPNFDLSSVDMLVESVVVTTTGDIVWYEVVASEGPVLGSWTRFFDALSPEGRRLDLINIGLDEVLTIYVPFSEAWAWGESSGVTVLSCPVPATTLYPLTTLYPC